MDTDVSNGHIASIFRVEVYRFRKFCEEIVHETRGSLIRPVGGVGNGTTILRGMQAFFCACVSQMGNGMMRNDSPFQGHCFRENKSRKLRKIRNKVPLFQGKCKFSSRG